MFRPFPPFFRCGLLRMPGLAGMSKGEWKMTGKWDAFNRRFNLASEDWREWRLTKARYKNGSWHHYPGCGVWVRLSPLLTFLLVKGKKAPYVQNVRRR